MAGNPEEQTPVESLSYFQSVPSLMPLDLSAVTGDEVATDGNMRRPGTEILRFLITLLLVAEIQIRRTSGSCSIPGSTISG
jgi:hypothetical protein